MKLLNRPTLKLHCNNSKIYNICSWLNSNFEDVRVQMLISFIDRNSVSVKFSLDWMKKSNHSLIYQLTLDAILLQYELSIYKNYRIVTMPRLVAESLKLDDLYFHTFLLNTQYLTRTPFFSKTLVSVCNDTIAGKINIIFYNNFERKVYKTKYVDP